MELSYSERRDWLRLIRTPTIGPVAFKALLERYGSAEAALEALPGLTRRKGVSLPPTQQIEAELEQCEQLGVRLVAMCEGDYPVWLKALDPPPPIIIAWGNVEVLHKPCVAIVGSRNASAIGQSFARSVAADLGEAGYSVVSGLARGIDTAAHHGSLETGTAAVLGGGVDHIYPRQNAELFESIRDAGVLISESPIGYRATARDFPRRNRIISGLSRGVVVIEAAERSGTLITARYALEQNRDVMAVPGSPLDPRTKGCNRLIRQGAALIEGAEDVIAIIDAARTPEVSEPPRPEIVQGNQYDNTPEDALSEILNVLSPTPTPRDLIIRSLDIPVHIIVGGLLELELSGEISVEPDGRVSLVRALPNR